VPAVDASVDVSDGPSSVDAIGPPGDGPMSTCGEASCQPVVGSYISHFAGLDCTGTESYYTPCNSGTSMPNPDGKIYSWDGNGTAGTIYRTVENRSFKDTTGACSNAWPAGNTLDYFVTIYR
jgi:hypothetical protein